MLRICVMLFLFHGSTVMKSHIQNNSSQLSIHSAVLPKHRMKITTPNILRQPFFYDHISNAAPPLSPGTSFRCCQLDPKHTCCSHELLKATTCDRIWYFAATVQRLVNRTSLTSPALLRCHDDLSLYVRELPHLNLMLETMGLETHYMNTSTAEYHDENRSESW